MALMLVLQLLPLGTALAADDPDADYEEVVETLPGDELDEAAADGEGDSDLEDDPDSTGLTATSVLDIP